MLTPYDPNARSSYNDNNHMHCIENKPEEKTQNNKPKLKRTLCGDLQQEFSVRKLKTGHNTGLDKESSFNDLKEYIGVIYSEALPLFNTSSEPVDFSTAYHFAAYNKDLELINLLLSHGVPVNVLDEQNENALMVACRIHKEVCRLGGYIQIRSENCIKRLLEAKCDPLQQNTTGISPFQLMAISKSVDLFKKLKELDYDLNTPLNSFGDSPLIYLCNGVKNTLMASEIVNDLVDLGCDPMQKNQFGTTPLEILVKHSVLNADGYLSLLSKIPAQHLPLAYNILLSTDNCKIFDFLIEKGVSIDTFDHKGKSPLYRAVEKLEIDMITYLFNKGANYKLQRPADSIHFSEASSPFKLLEIKMTECYKIIMAHLLQVQNLPALRRKKFDKLDVLNEQGKDPKDLHEQLDDIQNLPTYLPRRIKQQKDLFDKYPLIFENFLSRKSHDASNKMDFFYCMISYLLKGYEIFLQSEKNNKSSNEVIELLDAFQILFQKILNVSEANSDPLNFLHNFSKFYYGIRSIIVAQHNLEKTCDLLSNLMGSMENKFIPGNLDVDSESLTEEDIDIYFSEDILVENTEK